jgi:transcription elongation factor Elf1
MFENIMAIAQSDQILKKIKCNKCNSVGLSEVIIDYGIKKDIVCDSCGHVWAFDYNHLINLTDVIQEIRDTKPPRIGFH